MKTATYGKSTTVKVTNDKSLAIFAKLLTNHNINVIFRNISTAGYHSESKTIVLPNFSDKISTNTKMHLTSHECSHFLHPQDYLYEEEYNGRKPMILNIIDDVLIEKKIQDLFPGLRSIYRKSYQFLSEERFFEKDGIRFIESESQEGEKAENTDGVLGALLKDAQPEIFLSRLNKHLKLNTIGKCQNEITFHSDELDALSLCEKVENWEDVLIAHDAVLALHEQEMKDYPERFENGDPTEEHNSLSSSDFNSENMQKMTLEEFTEALENGEITPEDIKNAKLSQLEKKYGVSENSTNGNSRVGGDTHNDTDIKSELTDIIKDFDKPNHKRYVMRFDKFKTEDLVSFSEFSKETYKSKKDQVDKLLKDKSRFVGDLVQEFHRLKDAKSKVTRTRKEQGVLDVGKAYRYKTDASIFKNSYEAAKTRNHGFVLFLDFSSSMDSVLDSISDNIICLIKFCQRLSIPYRVYTFTTSYSDKTNHHKNSPYISDNGNVKIIEALTSQKQTSKDLERFKSLCTNGMHHSTGRTPLYSTMLYVPTILKEFISQEKVDKCELFVFTDGCDNNGLCSDSGEYISELSNCDLLVNKKLISVGDSDSEFDSLDAFYKAFQTMFNVKITTFFMYNNPEYYFPPQVKLEYRKNEDQVFQTNYWSDKFLSMPENFFKSGDRKAEKFFAKVLMSSIL